MRRIILFGLFLLPIAALLFVFRDVLFLGGFFSGGDFLLQNLPFLFYRGEKGALIAQQILSGYPLFVTVNASWFYPVSTFLFSHVSATSAYVMIDVGSMILAYLCTYGYARKIKLSPVASVLAAMTFVFSGQIMLWAPSITMVAYCFILPACLYLFEVSLEKKWWTRVCLLTASGALLGIGWLSSQVQFVIYVHVFYFVYVTFRLYVVRWTSSWRARGAALCEFLGIPYLISFVVGLPMIWAVLSFQHETLRASGVSLAQSVGGGYLPTDLIHFFLPFWSVNFVPIALANLYMGIVPLAFLAIAFVSYKKLNHTLALFFIGVFVFCIVASIRYSPLAILMHYLPFWNAFREASRIMFIGGFAGALLAGFGLDYVRAKWGEIDFYRTRTVQFFTNTFLYGALPLFTLFTLVRLFFFDAIKARLDSYVLIHVYPHTTGLPKEHYLTVVGNYLHQALDQLSFFDPQVIFFVVFGGIAIALFKLYSKVSVERFAVLAVVSAGLNFACVYGWYYATVDARVIHDTPHTALAMKELQKDSLSPYRFTSLFPAMTIYNNSVACPMSSEETVQLQTELLQPNAGILYDLDAAEGYDNFMPVRVSDALGYIGSESTAVPNPLFLERIPLEQKLQKILARKNALKAMNVKYIISGTLLEDSDLTLVGTWQLGHCKNLVNLYSLRGVWPRYFVTNNVEQATSSLDYVAVFDELNSHETPVVLFNSTAPAEKLVTKKFVTETIPTLGKNDIRFSGVTCTSACSLFIGNTFLEDWSATVDGKSAPIYRTNYFYMAVLLTPGVHTVVLEYKNLL